VIGRGTRAEAVNLAFEQRAEACRRAKAARTGD